jgi:hypothetical protein
MAVFFVSFRQALPNRWSGCLPEAAATAKLNVIRRTKNMRH